MKRARYLTMGLFLFASSLISQQLPPYPGIRIQGSLTTSFGELVVGTHDVTIRLYKQQSGGLPVYTEVYIGLNINKGVLDVMVNVSGLRFDSLYWVETQLDNEVFTPRTQLLSVPYAFQSFKADTATYALTATPADNSVTTQKILNGTIQFIDLDHNGAVLGQVIKYNGTAWVAGDDETVSNEVSPVIGKWSASTDSINSDYYIWADEIYNTDSSYFERSADKKRIRIKVAGYYSINANAVKNCLGVYLYIRRNSENIAISIQNSNYCPYTQYVSVIDYFDQNDLVGVTGDNLDTYSDGNELRSSLSIERIR